MQATGGGGPAWIARCWWCGDDPLYVGYHDDDWGVPIRDERALFELLCLEGFQSGLSWLTILRKRVAFREAFAGFDVAAVAGFGDGRREPPARRPGHRAPPWEDHRGNRQRPGRGGHAGPGHERSREIVWSHAPVPRPAAPVDAR